MTQTAIGAVTTTSAATAGAVDYSNQQQQQQRQSNDAQMASQAAHNDDDDDDDDGDDTKQMSNRKHVQSIGRLKEKAPNSQNRIKLSRELMVRLSLALGHQQQRNEQPDSSNEEEPTTKTTSGEEEEAHQSSSGSGMMMMMQEREMLMKHEVGATRRDRDHHQQANGCGFSLCQAVPNNGSASGGHIEADVLWPSSLASSAQSAHQIAILKVGAEALAAAPTPAPLLLPLPTKSSTSADGDDDKLRNKCSKGSGRQCNNNNNNNNNNNKNSTNSISVFDSCRSIGCNYNNCQCSYHEKSHSGNGRQSNLFTGDHHRNSSSQLKLPLVVVVGRSNSSSSSSSSGSHREAARADTIEIDTTNRLQRHPTSNNSRSGSSKGSWRGPANFDALKSCHSKSETAATSAAVATRVFVSTSSNRKQPRRPSGGKLTTQSVRNYSPISQLGGFREHWRQVKRTKLGIQQAAAVCIGKRRSSRRCSPSASQSLAGLPPCKTLENHTVLSKCPELRHKTPQVSSVSQSTLSSYLGGSKVDHTGNTRGSRSERKSIRTKEEKGNKQTLLRNNNNTKLFRDKRLEEVGNFNKKPSVIQEQQQQQQRADCSSSRPSKLVSQIVNSSSSSSCYAKQQRQQKSNQTSERATKLSSSSSSSSRARTSSQISSKKRRKTSKLVVEQQELNRKSLEFESLDKEKTPTTTTTNCDTSKCDSLQWAIAATNGSRAIASTIKCCWNSKQKHQKQPLRSQTRNLLRTLIWPSLLLLFLWLVFWDSPRHSKMLVSGLQLTSDAQVGSGRSPAAGGSDELSRAVLATMSTQSPNVRSGSGDDSVQAQTTISNNNNKTNAAVLANQDGSNGAELQQFHNNINNYNNNNNLAETTMEQPDVFEKVLQFLRIFIMGAIIVGDICGNSLVILSVCRHSKLRVTTNWFVVSLACADILVALFAMTFNASVIISGRWLFKPWVCDFWNSCDVLASTASILHLCCISIDRYIAIMRPLDYPMKITTRRVVYALCGVWISSALLSYIPIFTGIYTTAEHIKWLQDNPDQCEFVVNRVYAIVSSSISFWIPCCIMVFTYYRIYREATRQEKFIYKAQSMMPAPMSNHHHHSNHHGNNYNSKTHNRSKQRRSKSVAVPASSCSPNARHQAARQQHHLKPANSGNTIATTDLNSSGSIQALNAAAKQHQLGTGSGIAATEADRAASMLQLGGGAVTAGGSEPGESEPLAAKPAPTENPVDGGGGGSSSGSQNNNNNSKQRGCGTMVAFDEKREPEDDDEEEDPVDDSNSGQSTPTKRSISKMKREHKAAKTLGIIMGVFILCWLPFFSWYTPQNICGHACDGIVPRGMVTILFWIGYFNSTLNPIIYAYFNHEFRDAFKKTLQWLFCCCQDLKCLRVNRPNDNQHYNCTYRSTQEIGLVSNG